MQVVLALAMGMSDSKVADRVPLVVDVGVVVVVVVDDVVVVVVVDGVVVVVVVAATGLREKG
ncbi:MAG: hypothetical protein WB592_17940, partial [Acidimicrobiales bacterium]